LGEDEIDGEEIRGRKKERKGIVYSMYKDTIMKWALPSED
jgi:hypothetical protein